MFSDPFPFSICLAANVILKIIAVQKLHKAKFALFKLFNLIKSKKPTKYVVIERYYALVIMIVIYFSFIRTLNILHPMYSKL